MTTLRVLLSAAPAPGRAERWALFDVAGRCLESGESVPAEWPAAAVREAVLAAGAVRGIAPLLPPLPPVRVADAVRFALEDQFAAPAADLHLALAAQRADGRVPGWLVSNALMAALAAMRPQFARIVAEPALAAPDANGGWRWCSEANGRGFVRRPDGSAFPLEGNGTAPPAELLLALAQARRAGTAPPRVMADVALAAGVLDAAQHASGVPFESGKPWQWQQAPAAAFAAATDLLQGEFSRTPAAAPRTLPRAFKPALMLLVAALGLHVAATLATWATYRVEQWRNESAWIGLARQAGAPEVTSAATARTVLAQRHAEKRHAAGLAVADDALPLLARAAPALAALPQGTLKRAHYAGGAWTLELAPVDADVRAALDARLSAAGLSALQATTADGLRVRIGNRA